MDLAKVIKEYPWDNLRSPQGYIVLQVWQSSSTPSHMIASLATSYGTMYQVFDFFHSVSSDVEQVQTSWVDNKAFDFIQATRTLGWGLKDEYLVYTRTTPHIGQDQLLSTRWKALANQE